ncbi:MAG: efflux RND transporter periplasmic adaptor subunit [Planctomycetota bacterium]|nr:efflux RND transporter periplasmic adaptor subunit [Planctomycetota bacterium]
MRINSLLWIVALSVVASSGIPARAAEIDALTKPRYDLKLGFPVAGKVLKVFVEEGDLVKVGDPLIQLDDEEGESLVAIYKLRGDSDLEIFAAQAKLELAKLEAKRLQELLAKDAAAPFEAHKAEISAKIAALELDLAKQTKQENVLKYTQSVVMHARYTLKATYSGRIETVILHEGETIEAQKPVIRMVVTDKLWIDAPVPFEQTLKVKVGDPAWVKSKVAGGSGLVQGTVKFMGQIGDSASDTRIIRVEIVNKNEMPAGEHVGVSFTPPQGLAEATPKTAEKTGEKR